MQLEGLTNTDGMSFVIISRLWLLTLALARPPDGAGARYSLPPLALFAADSIIGCVPMSRYPGCRDLCSVGRVVAPHLPTQHSGPILLKPTDYFGIDTPEHFAVAAVSLLLFCVTAVQRQTRRRFGIPEKNDDVSKGNNANAMLARLYGAAKQRADRIHQTERNSNQVTKGEDMLAGLLDYAKDKIRNPPFRSVERNFIRLKRNISVLMDEIRNQQAIAVALLLQKDAQPGNYIERTKLYCNSGDDLALDSSDAAHRQLDRCVCRDVHTYMHACVAAKRAVRQFSCCQKCHHVTELCRLKKTH